MELFSDFETVYLCFFEIELFWYLIICKQEKLYLY